MNEPQIVCPHCSTEIKLTESLAAPLIAETRKKFEQHLASKETAYAKRESELRQAQENLAKARETIDDEVAQRILRGGVGLAQLAIEVRCGVAI